MAKHAFEKFMRTESTGAKKKEEIKQEKRKLKKEARAAGEAFRRKKKEERYGVNGGTNEAGNTRYGVSGKAPEPRKGKKPERTLITKNKTDRAFDKPKAPNRHKEEEAATPQRPLRKRTPTKEGNTTQENSTAPARKVIARPAKKAPLQRKEREEAPKPGPRTITRKPFKQGKEATPGTAKQADGLMPLNKYISHAGVCGRREAAELVKQGKVTVNGSIIYEPGFKVTADDKVLVKEKQVYLQHNPVYILLNKPKDYLTTAKDPEGRKTVFDLVATATKERVFPVGRLDRNTTGVLLLTNDGELAQKLTHPSYEIKKIYEVKLDKDLTKKDFEAILAGITLEDGFVSADTLAYADSKDKSIVGIEIHSGRNRIVRRIFEHLGYDVKGLDRVMFANLTKKNVDRGKYRYLSEKEVRLLKFMNQSFLRKGKEKQEEFNED